MVVHQCEFYDVFSWLHWMESVLDIDRIDMVYNLHKTIHFNWQHISYTENKHEQTKHTDQQNSFTFDWNPTVFMIA